MDAVGTFVEAVGKKEFRPYFADMMARVFDGIKTGNARLRGSLFFSDLDTIFEDKCAPYLSQVMPSLAENIKQNESLFVSALQSFFYPCLMTIPCSWSEALWALHNWQPSNFGYQHQRRERYRDDKR